MAAASKKKDAGLVSFTFKIPRRWVTDCEAMALREVGMNKSDIARRALAIGLTELKKRGGS